MYLFSFSRYFLMVSLILALVPMLQGEVIKYSSIKDKSVKLPYGKSITFTGKLSEFVCGAKTMKFEGETKERLPTVKDLMEVGSVQATFTGQPDDTKVAPTAVSEEDQWSATLGILRPRQSIDLQFRLEGQLKEEVAGKVASALIGDPQFQQMLRAFQAIADGQPSSIQVEAAKNFLQSIAQSEGVLEAALTENAPCISVVKDFSSSFASRFNEEAGNLGVLFNLPQFAKEVRQLNLDGITETSTARQIYELTKNWTDADYKKGAVALAPVVLTIAKRAVSRLQDTYEQVISTVRDDIVLEIAETAQFEETVDTTDLEKYAGFDVGVLYTPRVDELRQYFMIHIYPTGTVELEPGKIRGAGSGTACLSQSEFRSVMSAATKIPV